MSSVGAAGVLIICLAVGGILGLVAAERAGASHISPLGSRVRCLASGDRIVTVAASEEFEVGEVEGVQISVSASVPQAFAAPPVPHPQGTPPATLSPRPVGGEVLVLPASEGRALGLPLSVLSSDPLDLASRAEELASSRAQLERPKWSWGYLSGEAEVPGEGRWHALVVAVSELDHPLPPNATVDCDAFMSLQARVHPGRSQALRTLYLAAAGALLILLDRVRSSGGRDWSIRCTQNRVPSSRRATAQ